MTNLLGIVKTIMTVISEEHGGKWEFSGGRENMPDSVVKTDFMSWLDFSEI